ncbi:MAG: hypothetical protein WBL25_10125, partial [Anaerolineales bacterium]
YDRAAQFSQNHKLGTDTGEAVVESAEYVADDWAKQHEDRNNNNSNQNEDQSILYQTLAFFFFFRGE